MQWNLHITGESAEQDLQDVLQSLVDDLDRIGHTLTSATLTTDAGQTPLAVTPTESADATASGASTSDVAEDTPPTLAPEDLTGDPEVDAVLAEADQKIDAAATPEDIEAAEKEAAEKLDALTPNS